MDNLVKNLGGGNADPSEVLNGKTFTNNKGQQIGTMPVRDNGTYTISSGKDGSGIWFYIPYGYYPEYSDGKAWVTSDPSQYGNAGASDVLSGKTFTSINGLAIVGTLTVKVASAFNQRSYEQGFYALLDLGANKKCYSAQGYSGDSEGTKQHVTPQYSINNSTWVNYTGGTITARYWRARMSGGEHIGNFASVLCAYSD